MRGQTDRNARRAAIRRGRAFTLAELMVVIGIIALIAAIILPYFRKGFEVAHKLMCQRNLKSITDALHAGHADSLSLHIAGPFNWTDAAVERGSKEILICKEDNEPKTDRPRNAGIEDLYILQYDGGSHTDFNVSMLSQILEGGGAAVPDPQVWAIYPAGGINDTPIADAGRPWTPDLLPELADNQAFIGVDNDSAILITFGPSGTVIECREPVDKMYSRHWLMRGKGTPVCPLPDGTSPGDEDDEVILRMWSRDYRRIDPNSPLKLRGGSQASYGMNSLIEPGKWSPRQIMLMDANESVVNADMTNHMDDFERVIRERHMGKANVVSVDGHVESMTLEELEQELEKGADGRWHDR